MEERLFTPGPVEIPARILEVLARRPTHHRREAFRRVFTDVGERLTRLFGTSGRVVVLAASGTGGMESAVASLARRGEAAVVAVAGKFGERWIRILEAYGHSPEAVRAPLGTPVEPGDLAAAIERTRAGLVFLVHSETSTGTVHDLRAQAAEAHARGALVVADVVTSLAVHRFRQDDDQVDVAVAGSQKGLMLPPGLALVGLGPRALERLAQGGASGPAFYLDLARAAGAAAQGDTPFTPSVSLVYALAESLRWLEEVGLDEVWRRHALLAAAIREGGAAAGYAAFSRRPANSVTALLPPEGVEAAAVVREVLARRGFVLAGGQDELKGRIVRVGHMGLAYGPEDAVAVSEALEEAALALGAPGRPGRAADAARASLEAGRCASSSPTG